MSKPQRHRADLYLFIYFFKSFTLITGHTSALLPFGTGVILGCIPPSEEIWGAWPSAFIRVTTTKKPGFKIMHKRYYTNTPK